MQLGSIVPLLYVKEKKCARADKPPQSANENIEVDNQKKAEVEVVKEQDVVQSNQNEEGMRK